MIPTAASIIVLNPPDGLTVGESEIGTAVVDGRGVGCSEGRADGAGVLGVHIPLLVGNDPGTARAKVQEANPLHIGPRIMQGVCVTGSVFSAVKSLGVLPPLGSFDKSKFCKSESSARTLGSGMNPFMLLFWSVISLIRC